MHRAFRIALCCSSALPVSALAQLHPPVRVGAEDVRAACAWAIEQRYDDPAVGARSAAGILAAFCALPAPVDAASATRWAAAKVPTVEEIQKAVRREQLSRIDPPPVAPGAVPPVLNAQLVAQAQAVGAAFAETQGVVLVGLAQHAVGRAKEIVDIYLIKEFATRLCTERIRVELPNGLMPLRPDSVGSFLPETCRLIRYGSTSELLGGKYGLPSWGVVQTSLQHDLDGLTDTVMDRYRAYGTAALAKKEQVSDAMYRARERLAAVLATARFGVTYIRSHELPTAFRIAASDLAATLARTCDDPTLGTPPPCAVNWEKMPGARNLLVASSLLGVVAPRDVAQLLDPAVRRESLSLALKALAVNVRGVAGDQQTLLRTAWAHLAAQLKMPDATPDAVLFKADVVWRLASPVVDSLIEIHGGVMRSVRSAERDRAKILKAYVEGFADAAPLLVTTVDSLTSDARAAELSALVRRIQRYAELRLEGRYTELLADLTTLASSVTDTVNAIVFQRITLPPAALRTLQFVVDASAVKDADAFQKVLEAYAAPVDGFMRKRTPPTSTCACGYYWSINTYVGGAYGRETAKDPTLASGKSVARYSGFFLPVGLEVGMHAGSGAIGVMLQLADIGQVASWRSHQTDETVKSTPPSLTFSSVFAPGVNVLWNIPRAPLALGVGYAQAPKFRDVQPASGTPVKADVWRGIVFLAVDVPLFP